MNERKRPTFTDEFKREALRLMRRDEIDDDWIWTPAADKQSRTKRTFKTPCPRKPLDERGCWVRYWFDHGGHFIGNHRQLHRPNTR